ncbi:MAG: hypothetical protein BWY85_00254 [Firmicutes bacterium ADurb.Bin506]|nr:MAG: hypothetical protein BWY85_00254 [Firmicutes bacterium ADurb.Bin506]
MGVIKDTLRPEMERIKTELLALQKLKIHIGVQGKADSALLTIAGVHEYGATIRAKNAKNLAIPLDKKSEGKSPRDFDGLYFIRAKDTGNLFGVIDKGKDEIEFLFLLLPSVTIPERSFIRGSYDTGISDLEAACKAAIDHILFEHGTAQEAAHIIGPRAVAMTQAYIKAGIDPPKGKVTQATAKSNTPLYDTGRLWHSISYEIEEG